MDIKIGKGINEKSFTGLYAREAELAENMRDMTFQEIGEQLAKQFSVKDGVITLVEIVFSVKW